MCWVDSVRGVELMTAALQARDADGPSTCASRSAWPAGARDAAEPSEVDEVARAAAGSPRLRLVGVAGLRGGARDEARRRLCTVRAYLTEMRAAVLRLAALFEADDVIVTAGGSTYFDAVADELTGWPAGLGSGRCCAAGAT